MPIALSGATSPTVPVAPFLIRTAGRSQNYPIQNRIYFSKVQAIGFPRDLDKENQQFIASLLQIEAK